MLIGVKFSKNWRTARTNEVRTASHLEFPTTSVHHIYTFVQMIFGPLSLERNLRPAYQVAYDWPRFGCNSATRYTASAKKSVGGSKQGLIE
jgi:hypothetical protein